MTEQAVRLAAAALLKHYSFELGGYSTERLVQHWLDHYPVTWLRMAIIEALYQGRYKAVSVDQILTMWHRRAQPVCHYNHEFERMICNRFPRNLLDDSEEQVSIVLRDLNSADRAGDSTALKVARETEPTLPNTATQPDEATRSTVPSAAEEQAIATHAAPSTNEMVESSQSVTTFVPTPLSTPDSLKELIHRDDATRQPIHQFVPSGEPPEFYAKMRASTVAEEEFLGTAESVNSFN